MGSKTNFEAKPKDMSPLHIAVKKHCMETLINLLSDNVRLNSLNIEGYSALHLALRLRHLDIVNLLLKASLGENPIDDWGFSHLHAAAMLDWYNIVCEFVRKGADPNQQVVEKQTLEMPKMIEIMEQCRAKQRERCWPIRPVSYWQTVAKDPADDLSKTEYWPGYTPLLFAIENQAFTTFTVLLRLRASPNLATETGVSPLHMACALPNNVNRPYVRWLLVANADINARTATGETPMHVAVYHGNIRALEVLAYCRIAFANFELVNLAGQSCLHVLAGTSPTHKDERYQTKVKEELKVKMVDILVEKGCRTDLRQYDNKTALQLAQENNLMLVAERLKCVGGLFATKEESRETMSFEDIMAEMEKPLEGD